MEGGPRGAKPPWNGGEKNPPKRIDERKEEMESEGGKKRRKEGSAEK